MTDYGKLLELETTHGVPLIAIGQQTPDTPAGRMARNMMAAMGTFFTEQLALDVRDGLARRVRDGWFPTVAPYGYVSHRLDGRSVISIEPREADHVKRIFDLYAHHHCTIDMVLARLAADGRTYTQKQPTWVRGKIHRILRDREIDDTTRQQQRLLNLYLAGGLDRTAFNAKNTELRDQLAGLTSELESNSQHAAQRCETAPKVLSSRKLFHNNELNKTPPASGSC